MVSFIIVSAVCDDWRLLKRMSKETMKVFVKDYTDKYFEPILKLDAVCFGDRCLNETELREWVEQYKIYVLTRETCVMDSDEVIGWTAFTRKELMGTLGTEVGTKWEFVTDAPAYPITDATLFRETGYIVSFAIHPNHRQKGYGTDLLDNSCNRYINATKLLSNEKTRARTFCVHTRENNHAAQAFYKKIGFHIFENVANFYPDGESAIGLMSHYYPSSIFHLHIYPSSTP